MNNAAPLRIGVAGMGAAGQAFVPALQSHPGCALVAFAEPADDARCSAQDELGVAAFTPH